LLIVTIPGVVLGQSTLTVTGSILRLDEETCRIQFVPTVEILAPATDNCSGVGYCCWRTGNPWWTLSVTGAFGPAMNISPEVCTASEAGIVDCEPVSAQRVQFDFAVPSTASDLNLDFNLVVYWHYIHVQGCAPDCQTGTCDRWGTEESHDWAHVKHRGIIPARAGDSTALEPFVTVEAGSWAVVKQLYRD